MNWERKLCAGLLMTALAGCAAMKEGMANLNQMAVTAAKDMQAKQVEGWKADIAKGRYSGTVRVLLVPVVAEKKQNGGIIKEKAIELLRKQYGANAQFKLLEGDQATFLARDLGVDNSSLNATLVNFHMRDRDSVDVVVRAGVKLETYTGISQSTGKLGQGVKAVSWSEFMAIGGDRVLKQESEDPNFFKIEGVIAKAAQQFHETVLTDLMIGRLKAKVAKAENAAP